MKISILIIIFLLNCFIPAWALDVGDITSFIHSGSTMLSKNIKNSTNIGRLIHVQVVRITTPLDDGVIIPMESRDELLLTPASLLLPAQSNEVVHFYYRGPQDDKERYYRIIWTDESLSADHKNNASHQAIATASARISTILVVAPRQVKYAHEFTNGKMLNTGNATLRIIAYGPCLKSKEGKECKENYYLMPGKSRTFSRVDVNNENGKVAFWQDEHFYPVK